MNRIEEMREKDRIRKAKEIEDFKNNINVLRNNIDNVVIPSMEIMKETEKCYINYYIAKHPNCLSYHISMYKKDYPFSIYYTKEFYKNDIPVKYKKEFEELEKFFN